MTTLPQEPNRLPALSEFTVREVKAYTAEEIAAAFVAMRDSSSSIHVGLAHAWKNSPPSMRQRIEAAFPDIIEQYI